MDLPIFLIILLGLLIFLETVTTHKEDL